MNKETRQRKRFLPVLASLLTGVAIALLILSDNPPKTLAGLEYQDAQGATRRLNPKEARLTIVHFWASWCHPCVEELPALDRFAAAHQAEGVRVLPLSLDFGGAEQIRAFYQVHAITNLPVAYDESQKTFRKIKGKGLPASIFIDAKGREIAHMEGEVDWGSAQVKELVEKSLR